MKETETERRKKEKMIGKGIRCVHVLPASHLKPAVEPSRNDTDRYRPPSDRHGPRNGLLRSVTQKRKRENLQFSFCSFRLLAGVQRAEKRRNIQRTPHFPCAASLLYFTEPSEAGDEPDPSSIV